MKTKAEVVKIFKSVMSDSMKRIYETYLTTDRNATETSRLLKITPHSVWRMASQPMFKACLEIEDSDDGVMEVGTPTAEWLVVQWKRMYDRAVAEGNQDAQDKYLKRIQEHKVKFGEMLNTDTAKIEGMSNEELLRFTKEVLGLLSKLDEQWAWTKETDERKEDLQDSVGETVLEGNPVPA